MARARVPQERRTALTKPEIAIREIDRVMASGARFGCVLANSGYGSSGPFRQALSQRGLKWAVGLSRRQNVYPADVALIFPVANAGRPRKYSIPDQPPVCAEAALAGEKWRRINWRRGAKGRLTCLFAARRVRVADGHKHRMLDDRMQGMPGEEVWLVGERRSTGEQKYYVSNLPGDTTRPRDVNKKSAARHRNRACRPSGKPSSTFSFPLTPRRCPHYARHLIEVRTPNLPK